MREEEEDFEAFQLVQEEGFQRFGIEKERNWLKFGGCQNQRREITGSREVN